ncbi:hypothetical protein DL98DRAFT_355 [Cadophora sp. DSE1049]|nr:hypothetical protein DL98DRAFT_355 [Cadophora sp. DSE1049]
MVAGITQYPKNDPHQRQIPHDDEVLRIQNFASLLCNSSRIARSPLCRTELFPRVGIGPKRDLLTFPSKNRIPTSPHPSHNTMCHRLNRNIQDGIYTDRLVDDTAINSAKGRIESQQARQGSENLYAARAKCIVPSVCRCCAVICFPALPCFLYTKAARGGCLTSTSSRR